MTAADTDIDLSEEILVGEIGVMVEIDIHSGSLHEHAASCIFNREIMIEPRGDAEVGNEAIVRAAELDAVVAGVISAADNAAVCRVGRQAYIVDRVEERSFEHDSILAVMDGDVANPRVSYAIHPNAIETQFVEV